MAKKTLGYVQLEWTCSQCGTRNPGPQKACLSCGSPQPKRVQFHQAAEEELIADEDEIARAKAGPDVHCAFCKARNPATATKCTQCGADLGEAAARDSGQVLGAHRTGPAQKVKCPQCGALNDANALRCTQCNAGLPRAAPDRPLPPRRSATMVRKPPRKKGRIRILGIGGIALAALAVCVVIALLLLPSRQVTGQVQSVSWERSIDIQELQDVNKEDWRDEIPAGVNVGRCTQKHHHTQDEPAPNAQEVCGTAYTVDKGTGHGEVVQDCEYKVYEAWCAYTVKEWHTVDRATLAGNDHDPWWPNPLLATNQREGDRAEGYVVIFEAEAATYAYTTGDVNEYIQCQVGSRWALRTNALGTVTSIEPAR